LHNDYVFDVTIALISYDNTIEIDYVTFSLNERVTLAILITASVFQYIVNTRA